MKSNTTTKITANLSFVSLREAFPIGEIKVNGTYVKVNALQDAIDDGTIWNMMVECANQLYGGDTMEVVRVMKKNMSSMLTNLNKAVQNSQVTLDKKRVAMLREFLDSKSSEAAAQRTVSSGKPKWSWSDAEIDEIPADDYKTIDSVYQNMMSYKAKYPEKIEDMAAFLQRLDRVSTKRSLCKKNMRRTEEKAAVTETVDTVIAKLQQGKLTKAEKNQLVELLSKLK